jgi:hypothetical protein
MGVSTSTGGLSLAKRENGELYGFDSEHHREITNTGGQPGRDREADKREYERAERDRPESGPDRAGRKEGEDAWHNRSNRRGERGEDAEPGRGGNMAR